MQQTNVIWRRAYFAFALELPVTLIDVVNSCINSVKKIRLLFVKENGNLAVSFETDVPISDGDDFLLKFVKKWNYFHCTGAGSLLGCYFCNKYLMKMSGGSDWTPLTLEQKERVKRMCGFKDLGFDKIGPIFFVPCAGYIPINYWRQYFFAEIEYLEQSTRNRGFEWPETVLLENLRSLVGMQPQKRDQSPKRTTSLTTGSEQTTHPL